MVLKCHHKTFKPDNKIITIGTRTRTTTINYTFITIDKLNQSIQYDRIFSFYQFIQHLLIFQAQNWYFLLFSIPVAGGISNLNFKLTMSLRVICLADDLKVKRFKPELLK